VRATARAPTKNLRALRARIGRKSGPRPQGRACTRPETAGVGGRPPPPHITGVMTRILALALATALAGTQAPAQTICRPTGLGTERCSGPAARPLPRPERIRVDIQALDRMIEREDAGRPPQVFVPSGRRSVLGSTRTDQTGIGLCQSDTLGNLRCR
jgi:hypothetical protein